MILLNLLKDLTYGELSSLKMGEFIPGEHESEPDPSRYEQLMSHINLGLTEIYKRFFLLSQEIYIELHEEISTYKLHSDFAASNTVSVEDPKYIIDTAANPFQDNILKIEEVYDEAGVKMFLNDTTEDLSIYTPSFRTIQVPYPEDDIEYSVQYRATHPRVVYTSAMDPSDIEIELPNSLHEALLYYVASRAFRAMGGESVITGNEYFQLFENSCATVEDKGLEVQAEPGDWRFDNNGWV